MQEGRQRDERVCYLPLDLFSFFPCPHFAYFPIFCLLFSFRHNLVHLFVFSAFFFRQTVLVFVFPAALSDALKSRPAASFLPFHLISSHLIASPALAHRTNSTAASNVPLALHFGSVFAIATRTPLLNHSPHTQHLHLHQCHLNTAAQPSASIHSLSL